MTEFVTVSLSDRSYNIEIAEGLLANAGQSIEAALQCKRGFVVTDTEVAKHWLPVFMASVAFPCEVVILPAGEASKSFSQLESLLAKLLVQKPDRYTPLIALGGGVVGDITGFAASILLRGVPFVQIPTTLLAMVDSSVGGKTGINTAQGKNLIGSFYQPSLVLMDTNVLQTLPPREVQAGYAEIVKYGCMMNAEFFTWLETHKMQDLPHAIAVSCRSKAEIVSQDERETEGLRALLNFGHSFGHAMEAECGYDGTLLHGEAVAIGMVMAAELSEHIGLCHKGSCERIRALLAASGLRTHPLEIKAEWNLDAIIRRMQADKKNKDSKIKLILLESIGKALVTDAVEENVLRACWQRFLLNH